MKQSENRFSLCFIFPDCFGLRLAMTATPNERSVVVTFYRSASKKDLAPFEKKIYFILKKALILRHY
jgi:hypothetical protein